MFKIYAEKNTFNVNLAQSQENDARALLFDLSPFVDALGSEDFTVAVAYRRPTETIAYIAENVTIDDHYAVWLLNNTDTAIAGNGKCELRFMIGDVLAKSIVYNVIINKSIEITGEVPDPIPDALHVWASAAGRIDSEISQLEIKERELTRKIDEIPDDYMALASDVARNKTNISKDEKRIRNLELASEGVLYVADTETETAYTRDVPSNSLAACSVEMVGGMTRKWNQLVTDSVLDKNISAKASVLFASSDEKVKYTASHKFLCILKNIAESCFVQTDGTYGLKRFYEDGKEIITNTHETFYYAPYIYNTGDSEVHSNTTFMIIDLTAMYGSGNEPTSVSDPRIAWIEQYAAEHSEYDDGSLINAEVDAVVSNCANLWDEQWEQGRLDSSGNPIEPTANRIRSKNYINVDGGESYYYTTYGGIYALSICFYDAEKSFISDTRSRNFSAPQNARYMKFWSYSDGYGATYRNDIAIIKGTSGSYTPYRSPISMDLSALTDLDGYGLGVNDSAFNYVDLVPTTFDNMKSVDLGTLNWIMLSGSNYTAFYTTDDIGAKSVANDAFGNIICGKYFRGRRSELFVDKTICVNDSGNIFVSDFSFDSEQAFRSAMNGVILYYESADDSGEDVERYLYHKRVATKDLSTLSWSGDDSTFYTNTSLSDAKMTDTYAGISNSLTSKYQVTSWVLVDNPSAHRNEFCMRNVNGTKYLRIASTGTPTGRIVYELANEQILDITDLLLPLDNMISVEPNGTLTFANENKVDVPSTVTWYGKTGASV